MPFPSPSPRLPPCTRGGRGAGAARPALEKASHGLTNLRLTLIFHHSQVRQSSRCPSLGQPRPRALRPAPARTHRAFGGKKQRSGPLGSALPPSIRAQPQALQESSPSQISTSPPCSPNFLSGPGSALGDRNPRSAQSSAAPPDPEQPGLGSSMHPGWKKFGFASTGAGRKGFLPRDLLQQLRGSSGSVRASSCRACPASRCSVTPNPRPSFSFPMQRGASNCCSGEGKP